MSQGANSVNQLGSDLVNAANTLTDQLPPNVEVALGIALIVFTIVAAVGLFVLTPETGGASTVLAIALLDDFVLGGGGGAYLLARGLCRSHGQC